MQRGSIGPVQRIRRLALAVSLAVSALFASASPAGAAVTVGQIPSDAEAARMCASPFDRVQPTVTSGLGYVIPANGTITSWSTHTSADGGGGQLKLKIFRPVAGTVYMAVGHDGPRDLNVSTINTFPASVPVSTGDLLGLNSFSGNPDCAFLVTGESYLRAPGDLADGQSATFGDPTIDRRLNVSAVLNPSNSFTLGDVDRNKKNGTATLTVEDVPNPGELAVAGKGLKTTSTAGGAVVAKTVTAPGDVKLKIRAKGKKKRKLNETGKVKVKPKVTFTPTGGAPNTRSRKLKLKKR